MVSADRLGRRVVTGMNGSGRSVLVGDGVSAACTVRPDATMSVEIWCQERVPSTREESGVRAGEVVARPPEHGLSFRLFRIAGTEETEDGQPLATQLRASDSLFVGTVVQGRAYLVLEVEEVLLEAGDSFVIPGSMPGWRNPFADHALMVCSVTALIDS